MPRYVGFYIQYSENVPNAISSSTAAEEANHGIAR